MNWGYKICIVYVVFVAGITFMVFKSSDQKMDLVTTNYYEKELKYQDKIDETGRVSALSANLKYEIQKDQIIVYFPKDFSGKNLTGKIELYCPSDEDKDLSQDFSVKDSAAILKITKINKGQNELHISWQADGLKYYTEIKIFI